MQGVANNLFVMFAAMSVLDVTVVNTGVTFTSVKLFVQLHHPMSSVDNILDAAAVVETASIVPNAATAVVTESSVVAIASLFVATASTGVAAVNAVVVVIICLPVAFGYAAVVVDEAEMLFKHSIYAVIVK